MDNFASNNIDITLSIKNNTNQPQEINIMGSPVNLLDTANATRQFLWDISNANIGLTITLDINLEYKANNEPSYSTYSFTYYNDTIGNVDATLQGIITELNNLGIGYFNGYTQGIQVFISMYNDDYEFNTLNINGSSSAGNILVNNLFMNLGSPTIVGRITKDKTTGSIWLAGNFQSIVFSLFPVIAIYNASYIGRVTASFAESLATGFDNVTTDILSIENEGLVVVGQFTQFSNLLPPTPIPTNGIIRLKKEATILGFEWRYDNTFNFGTGFGGGNPQKIIQDSNGKYVVVGNFSTYNGNPSQGIVRINSDGSYDSTFSVGTGILGGSNTVYSIVENNGYIIVGDFNLYDGNAVSDIVKINYDGSIDNTFVASMNGLGYAVKLYDNKLYVCGSFTNYNGNSANSLVRINLDGSYDSTFNTSVGAAGGNVFDLDFQSNGKIIIGGAFSAYDGITCGAIARVNTDGSYDTTFVTATGFDNFVTSVLVSANLIYVGGLFTDYDGVPLSAYAVLYNQAPA